GLGPEADTFHAVLVDVAEARALPAAEGVISDRNRDRDVDPDHADIDPRREFTGRMAVTGENGDAVAVRMLAWQSQRFFETIGADDLQNRPENLFLIRAEVRLYMVEQGRTDKEALLVPLQGEATAVDHQLATLVDAHLDVVLDALLVSFVDHRAVMRLGVGRDADAQLFDGRDKLLTQGSGGVVAHRHHHWQCHAALAGRAEC